MRKTPWHTPCNPDGIRNPRGRRPPPTRQARRPAPWLPLLALFTAACAPVDAQQRSASVNPQPQPAAQASQPAIAVPPAVLAGLPPTNDTPALAAVQAAREAMNRKQWSVLGALVPQAKSDPLGMYPEYWLLRYQLWSPPAGGRPNADLQRFISGNPDAYLADRLRGDWLLAAARSGDFDTVRKLAPVKNSNAQIECAILDAHMSGQRATAAQAMAVFQPGTACWGLYDQLVADRVLGWDELEPQLRDAIEANKTTDARKFVQYMFEPRDQKTYDLLIKDPMKWLTRQDRLPVGRNEKLVTIALARLALRRQRGRFLSAPRMGQVHGQVQSRLGARPVRAGRRAEPGQPRQRLVPRGRPYPHDRVQRRLEGAGGAAPAQDRLEVGHRVHRRDAADPARRHLLGLLEGARPGRHRPQGPGPGRLRQHRRPLRLYGQLAAENWAAASRCRRVPRRSPTPRSPRRAPTLACAVPCSCSGWAGAPRPCLNGTSRCAA